MNGIQLTSWQALKAGIVSTTKAMLKWLVTTPTGWITLAIGATVSLITAYNNVEKKQNELIENARNLQEEYRSFAKDTAGKITSLEGQTEEFNKLAKGVDKYGNNISLASDEYDRYKSIVAEILSYSPELIQGYDAEGNAIADKNGLLERSIELLKEEQRLKLKEMTTDEKTGEAYDAAEAGWQQVQGYEGVNTRNQIARWFDDNALRGGVNYEVDIAKVLGIKDEWKEEGNNLQNAIINNIDTVVKNIKDKKAELLAISDGDGNAIFSVDEIDSMIDLSNDWQYAYNQWQQDIKDAKHGMDDQFDLYAQRAKSYNDLTDAQKVFVNEYIRATGDITDAEGHLLSEDKILEKAKGYEKFVNEFAELNKLGEGGSVDLTFRPEIDTDELNKKGWEAGEGFATVFSSAISNTDFDDLIPENAEDTVAINFTPIIVDPNTGEFKGVLSEEELYAYAHDVLAGVREDDLNLQIGAKFEGKNAIDEAVADGERIHYLHEKLFINNNTVDSWEELRKVLVKTGDDAVQAGENVNKMTVSLSEMKSASENISTLQKAFKELSDDGYITTSTLSEIQEATKLSGDEWDKYQTKLMNVKVGSADYNQIMAELTHKILDNTFAGKDLNDVTEDQIEAVLRENSVVNASAVAHDWLTKKKQEEKAATVAAQIAEGNFEGTLEEVASQCGLTTSALATMILKMINLNETKLNLSQQIAEIMKLRSAMDLSTTKLTSEEIYGMGVIPKQGTSGKYGYSYKGKWYNTYNELYKDVLYDKTMGDFGGEEEIIYTPPVYTDDNSKSGSDKNEALDNYLKDAENRYKVHQDETKYIQELQWAHDNLTKSDKERLDIIGKINEAYRDLADNRIKDLEHQNELLLAQGKVEYDLISNYRQMQDVLHKEAERLRSMGYDDNSNEIQDLQNKWLDYDKKILDADLGNSKKWIDERNRLGDWHLFNDDEVSAWERVVKWLKEDYPNAIEEIKEAEESLYEARKEQFEKATNFANSYLDSQKTLLQSHFDVTNAIAEAQHEINKELEASKTMYEYLDEDTRKLLFNQEDYNTLSKKLIDIQSEANRLQKQYEYDLEHATLNTIEEITSNYEMQYETLMKSYEIAKADLEIAKKKQKLNNVLNEKNVKMLIDGQWKWVANTQDVIDAQKELADAEYAKQTAQAGLRQTESINELTKKQNKLGLIIDNFSDGVITLEEAMDKAVRLFKNFPNYTNKSYSKEKGGYSSGSSSGSNSIGYDPNIDYAAEMSKYDRGDAEWYRLNRERNAKIDALNLPYSKIYGDGTRNTSGGLSLLGEKEPEIFIDNQGHLIPINQPTLANIGAGGTVFNQEQLANVRDLWDLSNLNISPSILPNANTPSQSHTESYNLYGDIHLNGIQDANALLRQIIKRFKSV